MAIACIRAPHYAIRIATRNREVAEGTPIVLRGESRGQLVVLDATVEATRLGVRVGMPIREATALVPLALAVSPDPVREAVVADEIAAVLLTLSPLVMPDDHDPGCWYVDLTGLDRHFGSAEDVARRLLACVPADLGARVAVAPTIFAARVAAGVTRLGQVLVIDRGQLRPFLAGASVSWLPVDPRTILDLQDVGIVALGDLAALRVGQVSARFGQQGVLAWELAQGTDLRQVVAPVLDPCVVVTQVMPEGAVSRELLLLGLKQMVRRAFRDRTLRGRFVREVTIQAAYEGGGSWSKTLNFKHPVDRDALIAALDLRLRDLMVEGVVASASLTLSGIISEAARQQMIAALKPRSRSSLEEVVDQLRQRYGASPLYKVVEVERWSRHPERQYALMRMTFDR